MLKNIWKYQIKSRIAPAVLALIIVVPLVALSAYGKADSPKIAQGTNYTLVAQIDCSAIQSPALEQPRTDEEGNLYVGLSGPFRLTGSAAIPDELCETVSRAVAEGSEKSTFSAMTDDTEISREEFFRETGYNFNSEMEERLTSDCNIMAVCVDGDNDGIEDIACEVFWGGTGGYTTFYFFHGQGDGTYAEPYSFDSVIEEFCFITYNGKHYLLRTSFDYDTKAIDGFDIFLYQNGLLADVKRVGKKATRYERSMVWYDQSIVTSAIRHAAEEVDCNALPRDLEKSGWAPLGTAEGASTDSEYPFCADVDHDGKQEDYSKYMWYPSNMGTCMIGMVAFREENKNIIKGVLDELGEKAGVFYTFWIDEIEGKPVLWCYLARDFDYSLYLFTK